ncbi:protein PXR1-like [Senna tora]|uniref:Protein PXR1-like n=1 Tax=Senna tora TaxID=362788 RepID=A0A835CKH7_9FABA|nr:protein PXR1-like [Senna tora]
MGGKGIRRREKNYRAAHGGGYNVLPPPPNPSQVDALPFKLRQIMSFTSSTQQIQPQGAASFSKDIKQQKKRAGGNGQNMLLLILEKCNFGLVVPLRYYFASGIDFVLVLITNGSNPCSSSCKPYKSLHLKDKVEAEPTDVKQGDTDNDEPFRQSSTNEKNKKKRKRKEVKDLRFEMDVEKSSSQLKRRERKKKFLEARKKKHKKTNAEEKLDFPGHEKIKFGDIVEAPPKLNVIPKAFKNAQDASQERLRLKAIEAYRSRKGWTSRPGSHLPLPVTTSTP